MRTIVPGDIVDSVIEGAGPFSSFTIVEVTEKKFFFLNSYGSVYESDWPPPFTEDMFELEYYRLRST
jgi:hypothetical protein